MHVRGLARAGVVVVGVALAAVAPSPAQQAYIGFVYPAGGRQGTTVRATIGGQAIEFARAIVVSGEGVAGRVVEYNKRMNPQEVQLLREQLFELRRLPPERQAEPRITNLIVRLTKFIDEWTDLPQCDSIANLVVAEFVIASNAPPGPREIRVIGDRGPSNPLVFMVGELPEYGAPPMPTCRRAILGKEGESLRRRRKTTTAGSEMMNMMMGGGGGGDEPGASDLDDDEMVVEIPCVVNGQIGPGTIDRFCFQARKGQRLVVAAQARDLIPYIADAVPGWFQAVVAVFDASGREIVYNDDYRFRPDPVLFWEVPADGTYRLAVHDAIFRGREDFVYRVTVGEVPFITSVFPPGANRSSRPKLTIDGWNLEQTEWDFPLADPEPGVHFISFRGAGGRTSNRVPFLVDELPDVAAAEPNDSVRQPQAVTLPVGVNGRVERPSDVDVFAFEGTASNRVVVEVWARRLDSPLDSHVKLTDATGTPIAVADDWEDLASGLYTHHADSYLDVVLPSNGTYYVHIRDTQHRGGPEYTYRLRISPPMPDFVLRSEPSRVVFRGSATASFNVHILRKDGFAGRVDLQLKDPPEGFSLQPASLTGTQATVRVTLRTTHVGTNPPVRLEIVGIATNEGKVLTRRAVPAEDRMQAFFWRHLVPARELLAMTMIPPPPPKPAVTSPPPVAAKPSASPPAPAALPPAGGTNTPTKPAVTSAPAAAATPPTPPTVTNAPAAATTNAAAP
ncbi:MAG: PPC domain-containing protein [Kiritimatiellae bacterium]|nr:PPC domain-containing protein [Kiritimatiellia bacterium]